MKANIKACLLELFICAITVSGCNQVSSQKEILPSQQAELSQSVSIRVPTFSTITVSEDCKKIAFVLSNEVNPDIYTACPDGSEVFNLTDDPSVDTSPAWSPDGSRIAFASNRSGNSQIYIMNGEGSHPIKLTSDYENDYPQWLPDGKQIAFRTTDTKGLWWWRIIDIDNKRVVPFTEPSYDFFFQIPAWSPDGKKIAYMSLKEQKQRNDGSSQIHVKNVDGSDDRALTRDIWGNILPAWSPDGTKIAFLSERDGTYNQFALYVMTLDGTNLHRLSEPVFSEDVTFSWSSDGEQIVISSGLVAGKITIINSKTGDSREFMPFSKNAKISWPSWQP